MFQKPRLPREQALQIGRRPRNPVVGERRRPLQREVAPTPDPDRRVRSGERLGLEPPLDGVVRALEAHPILGPEGAEDRKLLLEAGAPTDRRGPVERELVRLVPDRDAEREPAARHDVEQRDVLRETHGVVEGGDQNVGSEPDSRSARGEPGQRLERRGPVMIGDGVVFLHPDGVEAELFGARHLVERLAPVVPALDGNEPDLQARHRPHAITRAA